MFGAFHFYGLFAKDVEEDFFKEGKLYRLMPKPPETGDGPVAYKNNIFWKVRSDANLFKSAIQIDGTLPLIYVGIHRAYGSKFHIFLYEDMKVFTLGLLNATPSQYWEEATNKVDTTPQHVV